MLKVTATTTFTSMLSSYFLFYFEVLSCCAFHFLPLSVFHPLRSALPVWLWQSVSCSTRRSARLLKQFNYNIPWCTGAMFWASQPHEKTRFSVRIWDVPVHIPVMWFWLLLPDPFDLCFAGSRFSPGFVFCLLLHIFGFWILGFSCPPACRPLRLTVTHIVLNRVRVRAIFMRETSNFRATQQNNDPKSTQKASKVFFNR